MPETSFSRIKTWRRCHRQYHFKYVERLRKKVKKLALFRGTILHELLDEHAKGNDWNIVLDGYAKKYKTLFREEQAEYGDIVGDCRQIMKGYQRHYIEDDFVYEGVEVFVATDLAADLRFIGYIDKIVYDKKTKRRWLLDHKTHKTLPDEKARFSDLQLVMYVWAWNRWQPDKPIDGVLWDYLRTKAPVVPEVLKSGELSQRANMDTDYSTYLKAIKENKLDPKNYSETLERLKAQGSSNFFERVKLPSPSREMIESVIEDAKQSSIVMAKLGGKLKDRNMTRDCSFDCDFYNLCHAEMRGLDANFIRKTEFDVKDPSEHDSKKSYIEKESESRART